MWNDLGNGRCSMLDACSNPSNAEDVYKLLWQNFARHYNTNRAPIGKLILIFLGAIVRRNFDRTVKNAGFSAGVAF